VWRWVEREPEVSMGSRSLLMIGLRPPLLCMVAQVESLWMMLGEASSQPRRRPGEKILENEPREITVLWMLRVWMFV